MAEEEGNKLIGEIFGWTGTGLAIYFFLAPAVPFIKLVNEQLKVNDVPGILLICSFMNCILWADYGLLLDTFQIYLANGIGGAITLIWITIYLIYFGNQSMKCAIFLILLLMVLVGGISYTFYFIIEAKITGLIAMIFNVLMYAAPFEKITKVFKTRNHNLIPIFSTIGGFFCSLCWLMFGIYKSDRNLMIPNALGLLCAIIQVIVYLVFYCKKRSEENFDIDVDDQIA
jgi:solute carrier family 50 protein (sugar transporter)